MVNLEPLLNSTYTSRINSFQLEMLLRNVNSENVFGNNLDQTIKKFSSFFKKSFMKEFSSNKNNFIKFQISPNNEFLFLMTDCGKLLVSDFFCSGKNLVSKQVLGKKSNS